MARLQCLGCGISALVIHFTVIGIPAPQGSKVRTPYGMREDNPNTKPWRATVAAEAFVASQGRELLTGPLKLEATFFFLRPKSHYRTGKYSDELKPSAPVAPDVKPDYDKLARAIGDSLTGIVIRDDANITTGIIKKRYGEPARAEIMITREEVV